MEILITESAKAELDKLLQNSEHKNIRIFTRRPSIYEDATFDFELDEIKKDDMIFEVDSYKVIINVGLAVQLENISISYGGIFSRDKFTVEADLGMFR
ncbi:hypothetical protein [Romboutsia sp.]|uniref:hypothetical protein n=1 Tax=Romboutsia sp. TaxID=1965302 RepID=UPI003F41528A